MRVKERILALKFLEKQNKNPALAKKLGVDVKIVEIPKEKKKLI